MNTKDFAHVVNTVPRFTAIFVPEPGQYTKFPSPIVGPEDELKMIGKGEAYEHVATGTLLRVGASYLRFKEYRVTEIKGKKYAYI